MYNNNNNTLIRYKIVLLGDCNTGKSCLAIRYVNKQFSDVFSSTIGCSFLAKIVEKDNVRYGLDIWDTAGQERYRGLLPMYYRNSDMVIICVDMTENINKSITDIKYWLGELSKHHDNPLRLVTFVGTKSDLIKDTDAEIFIRKIREEYDNVDFILTSSKLGINVDELFNICLTKTIENYNNSKDNSVINPLQLINTEDSPVGGWLSLCNIL